MAKMTNDILSPEAMVMVSGSSIGTQKKYYDRGYAAYTVAEIRKYS